MSLSLDSSENVVSYIINTKTNKKVGNLSYNEKCKCKGLESIELDDEHMFMLCPRPYKEKERNVLFVAGESGAGKSYFIREYAKLYKKMFKDNPIYLISYLDQDETLDAYDEIIRINAFNPEFLNECMEISLEDFEKSMVIFDDIDSITNKNVKSKIYGLLNKMLRLGRHYHITVCFASHQLTGYDNQGILNESMSVTFFPKFLNYKKMKYLLEVYFGLSKEQIERIREIKDRSITYIKGADKIILSNHHAYIL